MRKLLLFKNLIALMKENSLKVMYWFRKFPLSRNTILNLAIASGTFVFFYMYALQRKEQLFFYDSLNYWELADSFLKNNEFSFTNYSNILRGYFFPFSLFVLKILSNAIGVDPKQMFYFFSAIYFSVFTLFILPWAFRTIFHWKIHTWGKIILVVLIFFFWRGHFLYPLTDFSAFSALLIGVVFLSQSIRDEATPIRAFLAGFFLGVAVNIRPAYQLSLIVLAIFLLVHFFRMRSLRTVWLTVFLLLGLGLVAFPQYILNKENFQVSSPWVLTKSSDDENLFVKQLFWGLEIQKYETNAGPNDYSASVIYRDPLVDKMPSRLLKDKTVSRYFKIIELYPLDIAVSYFRHFFNGLDTFFATPYLKNPHADHTFYSATNYLVWFLVVFSLDRTNFIKPDQVKFVSVLALLSPVVLAIPTAVEVRFFLPIYVLAYGYIAFGLDYSVLAAFVWNDKFNILKIPLVLILWFMICFTISFSTIEKLVLTP